MGISKRLRFEMFKRDGFTCQYCGCRPPDVVLELDHIEPKTKGGLDEPINLVTACEACNQGKADRRLSAVRPRPDADLAYLAVQQEIAEARRYLWAKEERDRVTDEVVDALLDAWCDFTSGQYPPRRTTLICWLADYSPEEIEYAMKMTAAKKLRDGMGHRDSMAYLAAVLRNRKEEQG